MTPEHIAVVREIHTRNRIGNCSVPRCGRWPCELLQAAGEVERLQADDIKAQQAFRFLLGVGAVPKSFIPAIQVLLPVPVCNVCGESMGSEEEMTRAARSVFLCDRCHDCGESAAAEG